MRLTQTVIIAALLCAAPFAMAKKPYIDMDGEQSFDGLYPIKKTHFDKAWASEDLDLTGYDKILFLPTGLHYRQVKPASGTRLGNSNRDFFPLDEKQKERLQTIASEEFRKEFAKIERFEIVQEPGPGVLAVRGGIYDIVSRIPPDTAGRNDYYLSSLGGATLVLEFVDAQSNTVIARVVDSRTAEQRGIVRESNPVLNQSEVRSFMRDWARLLRRALNRVVEVDETGKVVRQKG